MYMLKDGKNDYQLIDCYTGIDLNSGEYVPSARSRLGGSFDELEPGHLCKTIYEFDDISMVWVTLEPGVDFPTSDYVFHTDHEEVKFVVSGTGSVSYPDGSTFDIKAGHAMFHAAGQPYRLENQTNKPLTLLCVYSGKLSEVSRSRFEEGKSYEKEGGHKLVYTPDAPRVMVPGFAGDEPDEGHYVSRIYRGEKLYFSCVTQEPGTPSPRYDFVSHPEVVELEYVVSGTGIGIYPDKAYNLRAGLAACHGREQPHKFWNNTTDVDLSLLVFYPIGNLERVGRTHKKAVGFEIV